MEQSGSTIPHRLGSITAGGRAGRARAADRKGQSGFLFDGGPGRWGLRAPGGSVSAGRQEKPRGPSPESPVPQTDTGGWVE
jgi:hypothetical protein